MAPHHRANPLPVLRLVRKRGSNQVLTNRHDQVHFASAHSLFCGISATRAPWLRALAGRSLALNISLHRQRYAAEVVRGNLEEPLPERDPQRCLSLMNPKASSRGRIDAGSDGRNSIRRRQGRNEGLIVAW